MFVTVIKSDFPNRFEALARSTAGTKFQNLHFIWEFERKQMSATRQLFISTSQIPMIVTGFLQVMDTANGCE